jgi:hypothetical protein
MSYTLTDVIIVVAILAIGCAITGALVHNSVDRRWEAEATKHGYGGFNHRTGIWEWNVLESGEKVEPPPVLALPPAKPVPGLPGPAPPVPPSE